MDNLILVLFINLFTSTSLLMAWTYTEAPVHLFSILRKLGWRKKNESLWGTFANNVFTRDDWVSWIITQYPSSKIVALITCNICFSFHLCFWVSVIVCCIFKVPQYGIVIFTSTFCFPVLANIINNRIFINNHDQ